MSYYVTLDVTLEADERSLLERAVELWRNSIGIDSQGEIYKEKEICAINLGVYLSWLSCLEEIRDFSGLFPSLTVYGEGSSDEAGDIFRLIAKNGKAVKKHAVVIYPEFEELEREL